MHEKIRLDIRVRCGGLMRCCLETLTEDTKARTELPQEESYLNCSYCESPMRFRRGAWEWARDVALKDEPWATAGPVPEE